MTVPFCAIGYEFTRQEEIVGFLVSDTEFTQREIYEVLADVLYEASFFGYEQERLEDKIQKLRRAEKAIEEGKTYPFGSLFGDRL